MKHALPLLALPLLAQLATPALAADDPLTRPMKSSYTDRWMEPRPALPVWGGTWLTGSLHLNTAVIDTGAGLIVVDAGLPQSAPVLEAQIASIGHKMKDVRYILVTEAHFDHAGGVAALARDSGATVIASPYTVAALARGGTGKEDQQHDDLQAFPAPKKLRAIRDGGVIRLGHTSVTARFTPGHTIGSTSWVWNACDKAKGCRTVTFLASMSAVSQDGWLFSDPAHAAITTSYRASFKKAAALPCDILLTGHPEHGQADDKIAAAIRDPKSVDWQDKTACAAAAGRCTAMLDKRIAKEQAAK